MTLSIENIVDDLAAGHITRARAVNWLHQYVEVEDAAPDLRDSFACSALAGLLASGPHDCEPSGLAHDAYLHADAMIAERTKKPGA